MFFSYTDSTRHGVSAGFLKAVGAHIATMAETWRQRRHLAGLSDWQLQDIGLSRADVIAETARPFWRI
jgi:uncharacterized protein YjiS (DUF1127 family)